MSAETNQLKLLRAEDLAVIRMDGKEYLGIILKDELTIEYLKYCSDGFDTGDIQKWFKGWNNETLETITLSVGQGIRFRKLNPTEARCFRSCQAQMLQAKDFAMQYWENEVFDKIG